MHFAEPAAELSQHRFIRQHRVREKTRKADVVAADRHQNEVDLARVVLRAFAQNEILQLGNLAVDMIGLRQIQRLGFIVAALRFGNRRDLREPRRVGHPLVALVAQKQTIGDLGAGAGNADERHGPMRIFDRKLQRGAHLLGIERAMASLIEPARILLDERAVAELAPRADACRIAGQPL